MENTLTLVNIKELRKVVCLPSSKSISNRAIVIGALAGQKEPPRHVSDCDDTRVMLRWLMSSEVPSIIDIGAAGTAMRFSTALLSVLPGEHIITGTERMQQRPIGILVEALRQLGASITYINKEGFPPLKIGTPSASPEGEAKGQRVNGSISQQADEREGRGKISLSGSVSSQYISALLMIGPVMPEGLTLNLTGNIVSRPYIDMTLAIMRDFGAVCGWQDESTLHVEPRPYVVRDYYVESDWSAASYWYEMVALSDDAQAEVRLPGLFRQSLQGDAEGAQLFRQLGVETRYEETDGQPVVEVRKGWQVAERLDYDFVRIPDLAQTFVVTCCMMGVPFHFTGLQSLKIKETDRIEALKTEMRKLGYVLIDRNDSELLWNGSRCEAENDPTIDTYEDHRMAMAFAPAALRLGKLHIRHPEVVSKSYPGFWDDIKAMVL